MPTKPYIAPRFYPTVKPADPNVTALAIPGYYQVREYTCGFACTLMALHYYRRYVSPEDLYARLDTDYTGTSQGSIVRELRSFGCGVAIARHLDFEQLRDAIDDNRLIIGYHHRLEHWVVLYGYGYDPNRVFVADPLRHHRSEHSWAYYGPKLRGFGMIVTAPGRQRRATREETANPEPLLERCGSDGLN